MSAQSTTNVNLYALILAGGSGQRFWPVSRDRLPKQLLRLFDNKTLLEHTVERLVGLVPKENILILTNQIQLDAVREILPNFPEENILAEPEKRDTAPAIALGIGWVAARNPTATMMVLPSDHLIKDHANFRHTLQAACHAASESGALVTIGIKPTWACPGYGYIERGAEVAHAALHVNQESSSAVRSSHLDSCGGPQEPLDGSGRIFEVKRFREKPNAELAEHFLAQGNFTWNAGMFFWSIASVRSNMETHCPELAKFVTELEQSPDFATTMRARFASLPKLSIDYALMENAAQVLNVEASFDWDDVGNWTSVAAYLPTDGDGNQHNCAISKLDAGNNIIFSQTQQHIALLGVEHLMIISTPDALLIAHRSEAEKLKKLVDGLPKNLR